MPQQDTSESQLKGGEKGREVSFVVKVESFNVNAVLDQQVGRNQVGK